MKPIVPVGLVSALCLVVCIKSTAQSALQQKLNQRSVPVQGADSATRAAIKKYYQLGLQYKDGKGVAIDYTKAYDNFSKAAALGDAQSTYAVAYLHYKGLGCVQDYVQAARLFAQGAYAGRDNSIYFYALCFRNGYGIAKNEDSAKYWLTKAAANGYKQAAQELKMPAGENSNDSAKALVQQISNAALPQHYKPNTFTCITPKLPAASVIAGNYTGYLIQYDWSGQNAIRTLTLSLTLKGEGNGTISGKWKEDSNTVALSASLKGDSIVFANTRYRRKDHYSPDSAVLYNFENAALNLVQKGDSVFLAGNVQMFSPERKEPSKPLFVALTRSGLPNPSKGGAKNADSLNNNKSVGIPASGGGRAKLLKVYPNPFTNKLNVQVEIPKEGQAVLELVTMNGQVVYHLNAGVIPAGTYAIPLQVDYIAPATYMLRIIYNGQSEGVKVVKK